MEKNIKTNGQAMRNNLIVLGILVVIFGIWILVANISKKPSDATNESAPVSVDNTNGVTQSDLEVLCQDDSVSLIEKYFGSDKISLVKLTDYNAYFEKLDETRNGDDVYFFQWNGKNKTNDSTVRFTCYATGTKNNLTLRYLSADNSIIFGSLN